ncbi:unnamed protein product [Sphagnum troendelagicum]|uniref:Uncharacterized protein n=1 Tax=Sphagnum troendelagicum TaxID=128251 RepID=A0ABP0UI73_9BRYO
MKVISSFVGDIHKVINTLILIIFVCCRFHFSLKSLNHTVLMPGISCWQGQSLFTSSPLNIFVSEKDGLTVYDKTLL